MGFNIDSSPWKEFLQNQDTAFGYKVIQKDVSSLIVSDPLLQRGDEKRGEVYNCRINSRGNCSPLRMNEPPEAVNMSLGLSMSKDPESTNIMVCGPTIPKACISTTTYNGMCFMTDVDTPIPNKLRDCPPPPQTDIAFLLDGSGSVSDRDFSTMKEFVIKLIEGLTNRDIRFAVAQYSDDCTIHIRFTSTLNSYNIMRIQQKNGRTNTAGGINMLVNELFAWEARPSANRVLIVITDGVSTTYGLEQAAENAKRNNIIRYAIGVGGAFNNPRAEKELNVIASDPDSDYKFKVDNFDVLDKIHKKMETNIIAIEGYSMTVAKLDYTYIVLGAPRHKHKGAVVFSSLQKKSSFQLDPPEPQIGAYFGAEVCAVDLDFDSYTDLLLVSAPLHTEDGQEGKVFVFSLSNRVQLKMTLNGLVGQKGRFGSSVASPADLNGDKIRDVVVGAPLEDNGQGSIYIFNGRAEDITPTYSQRISGSSLRVGLRFFGLSLSESALDQSGDRLTDIAVGSKGSVILLRSRPIVSSVTKVTYSPSKITTSLTDCTKPLETTLRLCFTMSGLTANINYTVKLDAKRQNFRAYFTPKNRLLTDKMTVQLQEVCNYHKFYIEVSEKFNILLDLALAYGFINYIKYIFTQLDFEIDCGTDNICIDNLRVDFNFSGDSDIKVGIMQDMNVIVFVENRGENSYNSRVELTHPFGLSFRRVTSKQGRVECVSVDSDQKVTLGVTTCYISKPILWANSLAVFEITYSINKESNFDRMVNFTATANSGNEKHAPDSQLSKSKTIGVKYAIYVALIRHENSRIHINFIAGKNNLEKPVKQIFKVENDLRDVNLTILIRVPIKLGGKNIWANENLQIPDCSVDRDEPPTTLDFVEALKKQPSVNCSVAVCRLFRCSADLKRLDVKFYSISANVNSGWIEQTGLRSAFFELVSTATLEYDKNEYIYYSSDSLHKAPIRKVNELLCIFASMQALLYISVCEIPAGIGVVWVVLCWWAANSP
uniref:Integrin, alpha M (complement component 3 receptor 3 subunit), tandem duplicate 1 n=1 Tax=Pygocentrus nattereri TaxID=42514 RepID=A0AAR2JDC0_PYGNA